jgi:hypothetical protein
METVDYRRVEAPERCVCGAGVTGLGDGDCCPRCGLLLVEAQWRRPWNAERGWLLTVKDGMVWVTFGQLVMFVAMFVLEATANWFLVELPVVVSALPSVALGLGCFLAGTVDPAGERRGEARVAGVLRGTAVVFVMLRVVEAMVWHGVVEVDDLAREAVGQMVTACGGMLLVAAAVRGMHVATRMGFLGWGFFCALGGLAAAAGTLMAVVRVFVPTMVATTVIGARFIGSVEDFGDSMVEGANVGLWLVALGFWGLLNMALRRLEWKSVVCVHREKVRVDEAFGRSLRGRLVEGSAG